MRRFLFWHYWNIAGLFIFIFDGSDDGNFEGLFFGGSLGSTNAKALGYDEVTRLGYTDGIVPGTILGNIYRITLGFDIGTELGFLDGSFDGYNDCKLEGLLLGYSLEYTDGKVLYFDEVTA